MNADDSNRPFDTVSNGQLLSAQAGAHVESIKWIVQLDTGHLTTYLWSGRRARAGPGAPHWGCCWAGCRPPHLPQPHVNMSTRGQSHHSHRRYTPSICWILAQSSVRPCVLAVRYARGACPTAASIRTRSSTSMVNSELWISELLSLRTSAICCKWMHRLVGGGLQQTTHKITCPAVKQDEKEHDRKTCLQHLAELVHIARDEVQERQLIKLFHALICHLHNLRSVVFTELVQYIFRATQFPPHVPGGCPAPRPSEPAHSSTRSCLASSPTPAPPAAQQARAVHFSTPNTPRARRPPPLEHNPDTTATHVNVAALQGEAEAGLLVLDKVKRHLGVALLLKIRNDGLSDELRVAHHVQHLARAQVLS